MRIKGGSIDPFSHHLASEVDFCRRLKANWNGLLCGEGGA